MSEVDWTEFDQFPEDTCYCWCGCEYRSHAKMVKRDRLIMVSRKPCPGCGKVEGHLRRVSSDPEVMTLS